MTSCALVVPTRNDRPYLPQILAAAGCPTFVIPGDPPVNIQRWWNQGIDLSGADHVMIVNDDITLPVGLVQRMSEQLDLTGAAICYAGTIVPFAAMTGWAFMLNIPTGIRPDEQFRWYYGDTDLRLQAVDLTGLTHVPVTVPHHHPGESTEADPALVALAEEDRVRYETKWRERA